MYVGVEQQIEKCTCDNWKIVIHKIPYEIKSQSWKQSLQKWLKNWLEYVKFWLNYKIFVPLDVIIENMAGKKCHIF